MYEGAIQDLIDELGRLPGVGPLQPAPTHAADEAVVALGGQGPAVGTVA